MLKPGNPGQCGESTQPKKSSHGAAVCGESRMHGDNGGDGETQVMLCALFLPTDIPRDQCNATTGNHGDEAGGEMAMPPWCPVCQAPLPFEHWRVLADH